MISRIIALEVESIKIAGQLYLPGEGDQTSYPTVCACHGIPAHIPDPSDRGYALLAERICQEGFAVLIFNFRGTGASGGNFDILRQTAKHFSIYLHPDMHRIRIRCSHTLPAHLQLLSGKPHHHLLQALRAATRYHPRNHYHAAIHQQDQRHLRTV